VHHYILYVGIAFHLSHPLDDQVPAQKIDRVLYFATIQHEPSERSLEANQERTSFAVPCSLTPFADQPSYL